MKGDSYVPQPAGRPAAPGTAEPSTIQKTSEGPGEIVPVGFEAAAHHAHPDVVDALLRRGARIDAIDKTWGTPPLGWALTGWDRKPAAASERYYQVVARLVAAGAHVGSDLLSWEKAQRDPKMLAALGGESRIGERPADCSGS